jgi:hypothetical protein
MGETSVSWGYRRRRSGEHGIQVEAGVRAVASEFGVADFVFTSELVAKGSGTRELGDGLLIVGEAGAILQVKARDPERIATDSPERANLWAQREIKKAVKQANGSRREMVRRLDAEEALVAIPERVAHLPDAEQQPYALPIDRTAADWPSIVVVDHPTADLHVGSDCLIVSRNDWLGLYEVLGSVSAMVRYAARVRDNSVAAKLGGESLRYMEFYEQSATAPDANRSNHDFLIHPSEAEERGFMILNELAGKLWPLDNPVPWQSPAEYRRIVQFLDEVPPGQRHVVGAGLQDLVAGYAEGGPSKAVIMASRTSQLVVLCSEESSWRSLDELGLALAGLTWARHIEAVSLRPHLRETLGVALLRDGAVTLEVYCHNDGSLPVDEELFAMAIAEFGPTPLV